MTKKERTIIRRAIPNAIVIGMGVFHLLHFALVLKYNSIVIYEPNLFILWIEITLLLAMIAFAFWNIRKEFIDDG